MRQHEFIKSDPSGAVGYFLNFIFFLISVFSFLFPLVNLLCVPITSILTCKLNELFCDSKSQGNPVNISETWKSPVRELRLCHDKDNV